MPAWWETNDYDDAGDPRKQDVPAGWNGPFGPPKRRRQPRGACAVVLLLGALIYASGVLTPLLAGGGWRG
jgi:hypothetical protein